MHVVATMNDELTVITGLPDADDEALLSCRRIRITTRRGEIYLDLDASQCRVGGDYAIVTVPEAVLVDEDGYQYTKSCSGTFDLVVNEGDLDGIRIPAHLRDWVAARGLFVSRWDARHRIAE